VAFELIKRVCSKLPTGVTLDVEICLKQGQNQKHRQNKHDHSLRRSVTELLTDPRLLWYMEVCLINHVGVLTLL
jgi:hypothetical protein